MLCPQCCVSTLYYQHTVCVFYSVQGKTVRLSSSSSLPYDNMTEESAFDNPVYETGVSMDALNLRDVDSQNTVVLSWPLGFICPVIASPADGSIDATSILTRFSCSAFAIKSGIKQLIKRYRRRIGFLLERKSKMHVTFQTCGHHHVSGGRKERMSNYQGHLFTERIMQHCTLSSFNCYFLNKPQTSAWMSVY